jgi:hypothetical protein
VLDGLHFSAWSLLRHMDARQKVLLDFIKNPEGQHNLWPDAYWPQDFIPENEQSWLDCIWGFEADLNEMIRVVSDPETQLFQVQNNDQTIFWAAQTNLQHNAYHIGQIKTIGRQLGVW